MTQFLYVSSKDRINGSSSSFQIQLPQPINAVEKIELESVCIPDVIYNIILNVNDQVCW